MIYAMNIGRQGILSHLPVAFGDVLHSYDGPDTAFGVFS